MKVKDQGVKETATHKSRNTEAKETAEVEERKRGRAKPGKFHEKEVLVKLSTVSFSDDLVQGTESNDGRLCLSC